jgi:putative transposase
MGRKRHSVEQIMAVLRDAEMGTPVVEITRRLGIAEATFYRWKRTYGDLEPDQARRLKQLEDENSKLKKLVADLSLDKAMLQDVLRKKR